MAASLESVYWNGIHGTPYGTASWRALRFLGRYVLGSAIRAAVSNFSCFNHRVSALEANVKFQDGGERGVGSKRKAGDGLGRVVARIKALGVEHVYCWHALFGYWGGLHPDEPGVARFEPKMTRPKHTPGVLTVEPSQAWDPITLGGVGGAPRAPGGALPSRYASRRGVDGSRTPEGGRRFRWGVGGGPALARRAPSRRSRRPRRPIFPPTGSSTVCHRRRTSSTSADLLARCPTFYPPITTVTPRIANVAYNSVFMGEIAVPDWDMFQSHCGEAGATPPRAPSEVLRIRSTGRTNTDSYIARFPSGRVLRARPRDVPRGVSSRTCAATEPAHKI